VTNQESVTEKRKQRNKENQKNWYAKNKEKRKEYYLKNKDIILKKRKQKMNDPEYKLKQKEINKKWRIKHGKEYRLKNLEKLKKQARDRKKIRWANDLEYRKKCVQYYKKWKEKNKKHLQNYNKEYDKNRTLEQRKAKYEAMKKRLKNDPSFKISMNIRRRMLIALKGTYKSAPSLKLTGAPSWEFIWKHLESTFKEGMTRDNHGKVWHIDHVLPCSSFDLTKPEEQLKCFHYTNLQALFVFENLSKSNKLLDLYGEKQRLTKHEK
jgi:hypothetical protein